MLAVPFAEGRMRRFSPKLTAMLLTRGVSRIVTLAAILWGVYDWAYVHWFAAVVYGLLTVNYLIVYGLSWVAPPLMNGPWRIRPWQTFILLINIVLLPVMYYRGRGQILWGYLAISILFLAGLWAGTAIYLYMNQRMPMGTAFARSHTGALRNA